MFTSISRQNQALGGEENLLAIQVNVCYILKHLEDRKALSVNRQRWQAPYVPAEQAKRIICSCIPEICFLRDRMGPKSHKLSWSLLTRHLIQDNLLVNLKQEV